MFGTLIIWSTNICTLAGVCTLKYGK